MAVKYGDFPSLKLGETFDIGLNKQWLNNVSLSYPKLSTKPFNPYTPGSDKWKLQNYKNNLQTSKLEWDNSMKEIQDQWKNPSLSFQQQKKSSLLQQGAGQVINAGIDALSSKTGDMFGDSELGRTMGGLFSSGISSAGNTVADNLLKGEALTQGVMQNAGASIAGAGAGIVANYLGQGINALGGDTRLSRAIGQGVSTGLGTVGGTAAANLVKTGSFGKLIGKGAAINPYGLAASVVGSALGAATGPSKEYSGKHGGITQGMDTAYDVATIAVNAIPGWGQLASGLMTLNKGLSNVFGSTSGMTTQDAILGSAFMPAPVKWLNMAGASTTGTFNKQSWQNSEKANSFMGNAFGNLNDKFNQAREEAGKTYGTFSQGAYRDAQNNLDFANQAWNKILAMADQNQLQNIRSQYMSSINNQKYAQQIQGGWSPLARGKYGMKILNNATNHNIGMRLLSGAALIDNKQMILCSAID